MLQSLKSDISLGVVGQVVVLHLPRVYFQQQLNQCQGISAFTALLSTINREVDVIVCGSCLVFQQVLKDLILSLYEAASTSEEHVLALLLPQTNTQTDGQITAVEPDLLIKCSGSDTSYQRSKHKFQNKLFNQ